MKKKFVKVFNRLNGREKGILKKKIESQNAKIAIYKDKIKQGNARIEELSEKYQDLVKRYSILAGLNNYHSASLGNLDFAKKWEASKGKRVLFLTPKDYSGSFMRWAVGLHKYTPYAVRMVSFIEHKYGYDVDLVFPVKKESYWDEFVEIAREADIIHIKDEYSFFTALYADDKDSLSPVDRLMHYFMTDKEVARKPKVFTHYGGYARKFQNDKNYRKLVKSFDARIAMTPDLNFDWFDGHFIPHAIDGEAFKYTWKDGNTITHSPSTAARKATKEFLGAVEDESLKDWKLDLIQGVSHKECLKRKQKATIFFDQAGRESEELLGIKNVIGFYGNSALEAMVHGIPTIAHISNEALEGAKRAGKDWSNCPVLSPLPNDVDSIKEVILSFSKMSHQERAKLSKKTREWVEKYHSFQSTAKELVNVYEALA